MSESSGRLLVITHVVHYRHRGALYAYSPYVIELNLWSRMFTGITIAAPCRDAAPPPDCIRFERASMAIHPLVEAGGRSLWAKLKQAALLPWQIARLIRALRGCDAVHVRCPGNIGLLGVALAPVFSRRMIAKYAGQWNGYPGEPWSCRLQRWLLSSRWWRGPVTVYGEWPDQPAHVIPFFNSALTRDHMDRAQRAAGRAPAPAAAWRMLFVGRLSAAKGADIAIGACARLAGEGFNVELDLAGEGPERERLERMIESGGLAGRVRLRGGCPFEQVLGLYESADVLVLPSETEGWPKVLAEAMAFGVPCVATGRGLNAWMLGEGRGLTVPNRDAGAFAAAVRELIEESDVSRQRRRQACAAWGQRHSLEEVEQGLRRIMESAWGVTLAGGNV